MPQTSDVIHQISTPLTNVLLGLEELQTRPQASKTNVKALISEMKKVADTLQTRDVLERHNQEFSPSEVISELVARYRKPYHVACHFQKPAQEITVFGQSAAFGEIVTHLLNNAAEAYPHNRSQREISIELIPAMNGLNLLVGDNGRGISWWQKLLFQAKGVSFKKIKSGLGLHRVGQLLRQEFAGQLKIISEPERGTLVVVHFPLK